MDTVQKRGHVYFLGMRNSADAGRELVKVGITFGDVAYRACELGVIHPHDALGKHERLTLRVFPRGLGKHLADGQSVKPR